MSRGRRNFHKSNLDDWLPKTSLGKKVKKGEVTHINQVIDNNLIIREPEITDSLVPNLDADLLLVGQAKGKFGGGQRRIYRVSQKTTEEGKVLKFTCIAVVGNKNGIVGMGVGSGGETVPARNKSIKNAKKNIFKVRRGCGSWECGCGEPHSIPFSVNGRCSSVEITLMPAPKGIGLCINDECKKVLRMAGIKDVWSRTEGQTTSRMNLVKACINALRNLNKYRLNPKYAGNVSVENGGE